MRKILCATIVFMMLKADSIFAQFAEWAPWLTEIGVTPYAELNYKAGPSYYLGGPDTLLDSLKVYKIERTGVDLIAGVQVVIPPLYMRYGFSNIYNLFTGRTDTTFCPLFADWRLGAQLTYEEVTTYDISFSFLKSFAEEDFLSLILEIGYGRQLGQIQVLGNLGIGITRESVPDTCKGRENSPNNEGVFDLSVGIFYRTPFLSPYTYTGICYPFTKEAFDVRGFIGIGLQLYFPNSYIKPIPEIAYPKVYMGPLKKAE